MCTQQSPQGRRLLASPPGWAAPPPLFRALPWLVLAWVACNLVLGAADAEAWYKRTFGAAWAPRARLVPGVW
jgi:hypothetical protein